MEELTDFDMNDLFNAPPPYSYYAKQRDYYKKAWKETKNKYYKDNHRTHFADYNKKCVELRKKAFRLMQKLKHTKRERLIPLIKKTYEL